MTDEEMTRVAEFLRKQLRASPPERYTVTWGVVFDMYSDFDFWFSSSDPDFLPNRFYNLVFEDYPAELYG